jgi:hypothetical protein
MEFWVVDLGLRDEEMCNYRSWEWGIETRREDLSFEGREGGQIRNWARSSIEDRLEIGNESMNREGAKWLMMF